MDGLSITGPLLFGVLALKIVDLIKYAMQASMGEGPGAKSDGKLAVLTQIIGMVLGIALVALFTRTDWADEIAVGDHRMADLGVVEIVLLGAAATSLAALAADFKKALDKTQTAATPKLNGQMPRLYERPTIEQ